MDSRLSGTADVNGAWSCQVTLDSDPAVAAGTYTYTATGEVSGATETGAFSDSPPNAKVYLATSGVPGTPSITVTVSYTNPGGNSVGPTSAMFTSPGPSAAIPTTPQTQFGFTFPTVAGCVFDHASTAAGTVATTNGAGSITTGAANVDTTITGTYNCSSNHAPTADAGGPYSGNEGAAIALDGSGSSDPDVGDSLTYAWSYTTDTGTGTCTFNDATAQKPTITCTDNGSYTVSLTVTDNHGSASSPDTATLTVNNVAPTVNSVTLSNNSGTACVGGNSVNLGFTFTDPGVNDNPWTPDINWGDGSTHTSSPTVGAQSGSAPWTVTTGTYAHTYGAGTFTPSVALTDKDNGTGSATSATTGAVSFLWATGGILQPINADKSSNFKLGSTFPIKIQILDCTNTPVSTVAPRVKLQQIDSNTQGVTNETTETSVPDTGDYMRYDSTAGQWIYNLSTKRTTLAPSGALTTGDYKVTVYDTAGTFTPAVGYFQIVK